VNKDLIYFEELEKIETKKEIRLFLFRQTKIDYQAKQTKKDKTNKDEQTKTDRATKADKER